MKLVIVESPAKAKTIEKYLGGDYKVLSSVGHIRDIPKSASKKANAIDIEAGFVPNYYILEIVSSADYSKVDNNGTLIEPSLHDEGKYLISAQMGKRYDNFLLRAGIKENTGGVGIDYISDFDVLQASLDLYDANAVNDIRGDKPHLKLGFRYRPIKHINFYAGVDNFLNKETTNTFIGFGINFIDDDLKYLLISAGSSTLGG